LSLAILAALTLLPLPTLKLFSSLEKVGLVVVVVVVAVAVVAAVVELLPEPKAKPPRAFDDEGFVESPPNLKPPPPPSEADIKEGDDVGLAVVSVSLAADAPNLKPPAVFIVEALVSPVVEPNLKPPVVAVDVVFPLLLPVSPNLNVSVLLDEAGACSPPARAPNLNPPRLPPEVGAAAPKEKPDPPLAANLNAPLEPPKSFFFGGAPGLVAEQLKHSSLSTSLVT